MPKWRMVIDLDKCTGCGSCMAACKMENNVQIVDSKEANEGGVLNWMDMITQYQGEYPNIEVNQVPKPCFQCDHPPCAKVCPVRATYLNPDGLVAQIYHRCIGCRYCMTACPYTSKVFNWYDPKWIDGPYKCFNPDVSVRMKGVVEKCSFCSHRLMKAKEDAAIEDRHILEGEYEPACVEICPTNAIYFGDAENKDSEVYELSKSYRVSRVMESLGLEPKVYYLSKRS